MRVAACRLPCAKSDGQTRNQSRNVDPESSITMNTVRSVWLGWGTLMVAGGTAYYFAKRDINAHRREQELEGKRGTEYLECTSPSPRNALRPSCTSQLNDPVTIAVKMTY